MQGYLETGGSEDQTARSAAEEAGGKVRLREIPEAEDARGLRELQDLHGESEMVERNGLLVYHPGDPDVSDDSLEGRRQARHSTV